jgi:hypothetical protein
VQRRRLAAILQREPCFLEPGEQRGDREEAEGLRRNVAQQQQEISALFDELKA